MTEPKSFAELDFPRIIEVYDFTSKCFACGKKVTRWAVIPERIKLKLIGFCNDHINLLPSGGFEIEDGELSLIKVMLHHKIVFIYLHSF